MSKRQRESIDDGNLEPRKKRPPYIFIACNFCKLKKIKCSGGKPCENCSKRGNECTYRTKRKQTECEDGVNSSPPGEPNENNVREFIQNLSEQNKEIEKIRDDWKVGVDNLTQYITKNLSLEFRTMIANNLLSDQNLRNDRRVLQYIKIINPEGDLQSMNEPFISEDINR